MTYRNKALLVFARLLPCQLCSADDGTIVAAHSNQQRDGKGFAHKAADYRIAALCAKCHAEIDQGTKFSKEGKRELWEAAHRATIGELFERGLIGAK